MRPLADPGRNPATLSLIGLSVMLAGFGLLAFDAAIGVLAIPAGIALALAGMPVRRG